jgi:hypothetical protein
MNWDGLVVFWHGINMYALSVVWLNLVLYELGWISCFLAWYKDVCFIYCLALFLVPNLVLYELGWISCFLAWYKHVCFICCLAQSRFV